MKKPRIWDSKLLTDTYVITSQMRVQIEQMLSNLPNMNLQEMPHSLVPSRNLYEILMCYDLMYNLLVDKELLNSGNKKQDFTKLH